MEFYGIKTQVVKWKSSHINNNMTKEGLAPNLLNAIHHNEAVVVG